MIECLLFTCLIINDQLQNQLNETFTQLSPEDELVGYIDSENFYLAGIQTMNGKKVYVSNVFDKNINIHSHPYFERIFKIIFCFPTEKDYKAKKILGGHDQYLYCGSRFVVVY